MTGAAGVSARRVVLVTRPTVYDELLEQHATRGQVAFALERHGRTLDAVDRAHAAQASAVHDVLGAVPLSWRRAQVARRDLDRFLFEPDDVVVAVGPDGLVANLAKYLDGQPVLGVDAGDGRSVGRLTRLTVLDAATLLRQAEAGATLDADALTMVDAELDDGRRVRALNEVFVGHRSHQSARYVLHVAGEQVRQSSSGLIVSTGTGATGWAASIHRATRCPLELPAAADPWLLLLVREAWPSAISDADLVAAVVDRDRPLVVESAMDGGTVFGDGIESDPLAFDHGRRLSVQPSAVQLNLVRPPA